jgi:hypothetical protein
MSKNQVNDLITDQEAAFAHLLLCPTQDNYVTRNGITTDYNFGLEGINGYFNNYIYYHSGDMNSTVVRVTT